MTRGGRPLVAAYATLFSLWAIGCAAHPGDLTAPETPSVTAKLGEAEAGADRAEFFNVDVEGVLEAQASYVYNTSDASLRRDSPRYNAIAVGTARAMRLVESGAASWDQEALVRNRALPAFGAIARGRYLAEVYESQCGAAHAIEPGLGPHILRGSLGAASRLNAAWSPGVSVEEALRVSVDQPASDARDEFIRAGLGDVQLFVGLTNGSVEQALLNLLQMRLTLVDGELGRLVADPDGYIESQLIARIPAGLTASAEAARLALRDAAMAHAQMLTDEMVRASRARTIESFREVVADMHRAADAERENHAANPFYGDFPGWCRGELQARARANALLLSDTVYRNTCGAVGASERWWDNADPQPRHLDAIMAELEASVAAYLGKVAEAYDEGRRATSYASAIDRLILHNPIAVGQLMGESPGVMWRACTYIEHAQAAEDAARFWDNVVMWGSIIVGIAVSLTVVGAAIVGPLALTGAIAGGGALAVTAATVGTIATVVGLVAGLGSAAYFGYRGLVEVAEAQQELAMLLASGADPAEIRANLEYGNGLLETAVINGVFAMVDVVALVQSLRVLRVAQGIAEIESAIKVGQFTQRFATPAAREAAFEIHRTLIARSQRPPGPNGEVFRLGEANSRAVYVLELEDGTFVVAASGREAQKRAMMNVLSEELSGQTLSDGVTAKYRFAPVEEGIEARLEAFASGSNGAFVPTPGTSGRPPALCSEVHAMAYLESLQATDPALRARGGAALWVQHQYNNAGAFQRTRMNEGHRAFPVEAGADVEYLMNPCQNCQAYLPYYLQKIGVNALP